MSPQAQPALHSVRPALREADGGSTAPLAASRIEVRARTRLRRRLLPEAATTRHCTTRHVSPRPAKPRHATLHTYAAAAYDDVREGCLRFA